MPSTPRDLSFWRPREETPYGQKILIATLIGLALIFEGFRCVYRYLIHGLMIRPARMGIGWLTEQEHRIELRLRSSLALRPMGFPRQEAREPQTH